MLRVEFQFEKVTPKPVVVETIHKHTHHYDYKYYPPYYDPYWYPHKWYYGGPYYNYCSTTFSDSGGSCHGFSNNDIGIGGIGSASMQTDPTAYTMNVSASDGNGNTNQFTQTVAAGTANISGAVNVVGANFCTTAVGSAASAGSGMLRSKSVPVMDSFVPEVNDAGITVAGSLSNQSFTFVSSFPLEDEKHVIVLKLLGKAADKVVKQAVVARAKQTCTSCGTRNRGQNKCCRECGTALEIV